MATVNKGVAASKKGAAARAERNGKALEVGFRGLKIKLPPKLMASVIFRAGRLRDDDVQAATRLVESVIGPEQFDQVLDKMDEDGLTFDDEEGMSSIGELLRDALGTYGLTAGESKASKRS